MPIPLDYLREHTSDIEHRFVELLRIPSVSTDPAREPDVARSAQWAKDHLESSGLEVRVIQTDGLPVVLAKSNAQQVADQDAPRVLFYGHLDVQPADPLEAWASPPFEPAVSEGVITARGASDDKAGVLSFLEALRAYHETQTPLPGPITVLLECEEEIGSPSLPAFLTHHRDELAAEVVVICDTTMWDATPGQSPRVAITTSLRGLVYLEVTLHGPTRDLHSGVYGGAIANPATQLTRVLGKLIDDDQRVTVPGFYDQVAPPPTHGWEHLNFDDEAFCQDVGLPPFGTTVPQVSPRDAVTSTQASETLVRRWALPALDINGLLAGYTQPGAKTVIPTHAHAKVSVRLAPGMEPDRTQRLLIEWLERQEVGGCRWDIKPHHTAHPVQVDEDSPWIAAAVEGITNGAGHAPLLVAEGATIPVVADFKQNLGIDSLLIGFGLNSDNIHSPNEHIALERLHLGCQTLVSVLAALAQVRR